MFFSGDSQVVARLLTRGIKVKLLADFMRLLTELSSWQWTRRSSTTDQTIHILPSLRLSGLVVVVFGALFCAAFAF